MNMATTIIACVIALGSAQHPNRDAAKTNKATDADPKPTTTFVDNRQSAPAQERPQQQNPKWLATSAPAEWALVIVGLGGVIAAYFTLRAIRDQSEQMGRQVEAALWQVKSMGQQVTEMTAQTVLLENSVAVARDAAKAAQDGANAAKESADATRDSVETFISKERARLRITALPFDSNFSTASTFVQYRVSFYGIANAFISQSAAYAVITTSKIPEITDEHAAIFRIPLPDVVTSAPDLETLHMIHAYRDELNQLSFKLTVDAINEARAFVHFYAFIKYRTLDTDRETRVCLTWVVNPAVNALAGDSFNYWKNSGLPDANRET
jgi:outer membrane murein-binding lipoprotein Lpp